MPQSPILLVHGAWQTAATWDLVIPHLRKSGRRVFNALLTGLEGDANALTEAVNLDTHTRDVEALVDREHLNDVVLVGHSYAGMIITGVAEGPARDFVRGRLCDFTIRCFEQALHAPTHAATTLERTYISCVREGYPARAVFEQFAKRAQRERWEHNELPTGHDCHVELPDVVSELVLKTAV